MEYPFSCCSCCCFCSICSILLLVSISLFSFQELKQDKPETEMIRILQKEAAEDFETQRKKSSFRFTSEQVKFISGMLDKHGNDFKVGRLNRALVCRSFFG